MRLSELAPILQENHTPERGHGVIRINHPEWQNIPFVVPPPPPKEMAQKDLPFNIISEALKILNSLPSSKEMSEFDKIINYLFIRREAVQSSRLEGTWSTIDHALTPGEMADEGKGKDAHVAVRSYAKLMEEIVEETLKKKESVFSIEMICKIQKTIIENDPNSKGVPGKIRTEGEPGSIVTIGGLNRKEDSIYNPPPPTEVRKSLQKVLEWFADEEIAARGDAGIGLTLPVRLAIGHSHFEAVHPFTDGNGRTGRTLWPLQMICAGNTPLYLSGYVEEKKTDYYRSLEEAQKRLNYVPLIKFICDAIIESDLELKKSKEIIKNFPDEWQERGKFRKDSAALRALPVLLYKPILTSEVLQLELGISGPASTNAISQLLKAKVIRLRHFENRKRVYAAEELIAVLSRPFGSDIDIALEKARKLLDV